MKFHTIIKGNEKNKKFKKKNNQKLRRKEIKEKKRKEMAILTLKIMTSSRDVGQGKRPGHGDCKRRGWIDANVQLLR